MTASACLNFLPYIFGDVDICLVFFPPSFFTTELDPVEMKMDGPLRDIVVMIGLGR